LQAAVVWVKRAGVEGSQYIKLRDLDLAARDVYDLTARWLAAAQPSGAAADMVSLRLLVLHHGGKRAHARARVCSEAAG
jgi:hypothetical protein